jgi:eukaryotic-like serine/threonine-protein kinase
MNETPPDASGMNLEKLIADARGQAERVGSFHGLKVDSIRGYELIREIHRGGQGVVYLAHQRATNRNVAIKILREGPFAGPGERARHEREVQILAALQHPNIVAIHDSGIAADNYYFVMDYIAGLPLDEWADRHRREGAHSSSGKGIRSGHRDRQAALLGVFIKICDALNVAHQRGVIHRDLKPTNIRIAENDEPFVLDFGLAKLTTGEAGASIEQGLTATGQFLGTLPWASPEQVAEKNYHADIRTDVYALGLMLYRALTGRLPYALDSSVAEIIRVITQVDPARPRTLVRDLDGDLETIVLKCLSKDPNRRYQTAAAVADDLRHYLLYEPISARRDSGWYSLRMFARRHRVAVGLTTGLIGLLACASILLAYLYVQAKASERLALSREEETRKVAEFQAAQLAGINAEVMGKRLREEILAQATRQGAGPPQQLDGEPTALSLEQALQAVNFTDLALKTLDENIFVRAQDAIDKQFQEQPLVRAALLQTLAATLGSVGLISRAVQPQEIALDLRTKLLGPEHPQTLMSLHERGRLNRARGETTAARDDFLEALQLRRRVLGPEDPETLSTENELGGLLLQLEQVEEAETYVRHVYDVRRRTLGEDHPMLLSSLNELGNIHYIQGEFDKSIDLFRKAVESTRRSLGPDHPKTQSLMNNLASVLTVQGESKQASEVFRELLVIRRRTLGEKHPQTLNVMDNLANALADVDIEESLALRTEAHTTLRSTLGEKHPRTLSSLTGICHILMKLKRFEEAAPYVEKSLELHREVLGDDHSETILAQRHMATLLARTGKVEEAIVRYQEALSASKRVLGESHRESISAQIILGGILETAGKAVEAEPYLLEAVTLSRKHLGETNSLTLNAMTNLAELLIKLERYSEAQALYESTRAGYLSTSGKDSPKALSATLGLGLALKLQGRFEEAREMYTAALDGAISSFGEEGEFSLQVLNRIGELEIAQRKFEDAHARLSRVLSMSRKTLGDDHDETWRSRINLGEVLTRLNRFDEAETVLLDPVSQMEVLPSNQELRSKALHTIMELYEAWDERATDGPHSEQLRKWREKQAEKQTDRPTPLTPPNH